MTDGPLRVLLIIMDADLRSAVADYLLLRRLAVEQVGSPQAALEHLATHTSDMVLFDLHGLEGEHSLAWLTANRGRLDLSRAPIAIFRQERPTPQEQQVARELGFVFFIPRPTAQPDDLDVLLRTVRRTVEARQQRDRGVAPASDREATGSAERPDQARPGSAVHEDLETDRDLSGRTPVLPPPPTTRAAPPPVVAKRPSKPQEASRHAPLPTQGKLRSISLPEILFSFFTRSISGKLILFQGSVRKRIYFMGGYPVFASSNSVAETLGEDLLAEGRLTRLEHAQVLERMRRSGRRIGEVLVELDFVSRTELPHLINENIKRKILNAFASREGTYRFDEGTRFGEHEYNFSLSPPRLIIDGLVQYGDDVLAARHLPASATARPHLIEHPLWESGDLELTDREVEISKLLEQSHPSKEIARRTGERQVPRFLLALALLRLVGFREGPSAEDAAARPEKKRITVVPRRETRPPQPKEVKRESVRITDSDFFTILGVSRDATPQQIHRAFRDHMKSYQPDVISALPAKEHEAAEVIQRKLVAAYLVLADPMQRQQYLQDLIQTSIGAEEAARRATERRQRNKVSSPPRGVPPSKSPQPAGPVKPSEPLERPPPVKSPRELFLEAKAALGNGRAQEAALAMREALALDPGQPYLLAWAGWTLFWANPRTHMKNARDHLEQAIRSDATHPEAYLFLARILEFGGEYDEALKYYQAAIKTPNAPPSYAMEARSFQERFQEGRLKARSTGLRLADVMGDDERTLFKRWVLNE